ncbi:hypothetical protein JCM11251_001913 [Rhodosporidiobolus azoricus]
MVSRKPNTWIDKTSRQLDESVVAELKGQPLHPGCRAFLLAYYQMWQDGWGKPGAKVLGGVPCATFNMSRPLSAEARNIVIVRPDYLSLQKVIDSEAEKKSGMGGGLIVYGSLGIGKSTALAFLANRFLEQMRPFIYLMTGTDIAYVFCDVGVFSARLSGGFLRSISVLAPFILLADSSPSPIVPPWNHLLDIPNIFTVLASDLEHGLYENVSGDRGCSSFTLDGWTEMELAAVCWLRHHPAPIKAANAVPFDSLPPLHTGTVPPPSAPMPPSVPSLFALSSELVNAHLDGLDAPAASDLPVRFCPTFRYLPAFLRPPMHYQPLNSVKDAYTPYELFQLHGPQGLSALLDMPDIPRREGPERDLAMDGPISLVQDFESFTHSLNQCPGAQGWLHYLHKYLIFRPARANGSAHWRERSRFALTIASPFVRAYLHRSLQTRSRRTQLHFVHALMHNYRLLRSFVFECLAVRYLVVAQKELELEVVAGGRGGGKTLHAPVPIDVEEWDPKIGPPNSPPSEAVLLLLPRTFGSFHAILLSNAGGAAFFLQVAGSEEIEPIAQDKLEELLTRTAPRH